MKFLSLIILFFCTNVIAETIQFSKENTVLLSYGKINPNKVTFNKESLTIKVDNSSGPIVYPLPSPKKISKLVINAKIDGSLRLSGKQGGKGNDDFRLRIGLVYEGDKTLSFLQKKVAAQWIKTLFNLAKGKAKGIEEVYFYNTYSDSSLKSTTRKHPLSKLLKEDFSLRISENGEINQEIIVPSDNKVLGLWISSDGDDTASRYIVTINKIEVF